jgi:anti-anti-sigma factor
MMDESLDHIVASQNGDVLVLEINSPALNDFDLSHATAREIERTLSTGQVTKAVLSLKNVEFATSVGLIVFSRIIAFVKRAGVQLVLCDASEQIAKLLKIARLVRTEQGSGDQKLLLAADLNAALAELK